MFLVSIKGFKLARHSGIVRKYARHCIVGEQYNIAAICSRSNNKLISFRHNRDIFVFFVSIMGFSGMPDIVVLSGNIFDIALWVRH